VETGSETKTSDSGGGGGPASDGISIAGHVASMGGTMRDRIGRYVRSERLFMQRRIGDIQQYCGR
jgi:hypothetical protein